jgi:dolichol-phosphate mannosyltransferase
VKLSVIIPAFNEKGTIAELLRRVTALDLDKQIIVVDDGSSDGTREILREIDREDVIVAFHEKNQGKGAAVRTGFKLVDGDVAVIQDADLEYDPHDLLSMLAAMIDGKAQVVYGSRILRQDNPHGGLPFHLGGRLVTVATNLLFGSKLTDEPTCYKMFRTEVLQDICIESDGFEWEPEVTAKILTKGIRIIEVPISYKPRSVARGKKIKPVDGIKAIWTLLKYRLFR